MIRTQTWKTYYSQYMHAHQTHTHTHTHTTHTGVALAPANARSVNVQLVDSQRCLWAFQAPQQTPLPPARSSISSIYLLRVRLEVCKEGLERLDQAIPSSPRGERMGLKGIRHLPSTQRNPPSFIDSKGSAFFHRQWIIGCCCETSRSTSNNR